MKKIACICFTFGSKLLMVTITISICHTNSKMKTTKTYLNFLGKKRNEGTMFFPILSQNG